MLAPPLDTIGAFLPGPRATIAGAPQGTLAELTCGVKDAIDLAGYTTGAGNPDWLRTHPPASQTAPAVQSLLDAGANVVGKTITDELTFSLNGQNIHYGTPANSRAPDRIPGGSSSGSAAAVTGGLVDFALGTDCGGSIRAPASYCGICGMRPTHGRISTAGVFRLAPSFDTVGWFARDAKLLQRVGRVLFADNSNSPAPRRLLVAADAFDWSGDAVRDALQDGVERLRKTMRCAESVTVEPDGLDSWLKAFRTLQGAEIWEEHGAWIRAVNPDLAPDIRQRFEWTSTITQDDVNAAQKVRAAANARMRSLLGSDVVLCLPTVPGIAPLKNMPGDELVEFRNRALSLLCIAGLAGLPQINLPVGTIDGCPLGLSIVGCQNSDTALLQLAVSVAT